MFFSEILLNVICYGGLLCCFVHIIQWNPVLSLCLHSLTKPVNFGSVQQKISVWQMFCNPSQKSNYCNNRHVLWHLDKGVLTYGFEAKGAFNSGLQDTLEMSRDVTKVNKLSVCPAKTQISLGIRPGWSESSLEAQPFCWFCHVAAQIVVKNGSRTFCPADFLFHPADFCFVLQHLSVCLTNAL